ncbi:MAG: hypothetical protein KC609_18280 [Myxococcales bacterium]|nr:hypothetical protein [Myxococcales bacterium]
MIPWELLGSESMPDGYEVRLYRRGEEYSIRVAHYELMNSKAHRSEDALAELACAMLQNRETAQVLVGGLGLGYTTAAALAGLGEEARVVVAELVPAVVEWNRTFFGHLAGHPLGDRRVVVEIADVADMMRRSRGTFDSILLDVDNGPQSLTRRQNDWLYDHAGLSTSYAALRPRGVLGIWSAGADADFTKRLERTGFEVREERSRSRAKRKGSRHTIWLARRPG